MFIKVSKTKCLAAYGQICNVLFGANRFPISTSPTKLPEGIEESVSFDTNPQAEAIAAEMGDAPEATTDLLPGETLEEQEIRLGAKLEEELAPVAGKLQKGAGKSPTEVTFHPAEVAAKKMEKKILDQLEESNASKELRHTVFECVLFGTGIMKGPFAVDKEYPSWDEDGDYDPHFKIMPKTSSVSVWNFYPDPDANNMDEAEYVVERHKMSKSKLLALKTRPFFRENAIDKAAERGENYIKEYWEHAMGMILRRRR